MIKIDLKHDLLLVVDMENDFIIGSLAVNGATAIIPIINKYIKKILRRVFSKDIHPVNHCSFVEQGGPWPPHCVVNTEGAELHSDLDINPKIIMTVVKGFEIDRDAYSAFDETGLGDVLPGMGIKRIFICGLATDYCVLATVLDALKLKGIEIYVLIDAIRAVNVKPGDGDAAIQKMKDAGAKFITLNDLE